MIAEYLKRINYKGSINLDSKTLIALHKAHVTAIPFDNIDIMSGDQINLSFDFLFRKIILRKRGGICYELNVLFYTLLLRFGFKVKIVSAITKYGEIYGEEYDHMALTVELENKTWLVDVGLREALWYPIDISCQRWRSQGIRSYSVFRDLVGNYHFLKMVNNQVFEDYKFSLTARNPDQFAGMFHFHESNPQSPLNRYLLCSLETKEGRLVIKGNKIIVEAGGSISETTIERDEPSYRSLKKYCLIFGFEDSVHEKLFNLVCNRSTIAA